MSVSLQYIYGINSQIRKNGHFLDSENIAYMAGQNLVVYNRVSNKQCYPIEGSSDIIETITSMTINESKKMIAIGTRSENPKIYLFDCKSGRRKKILSHLDSSLVKEYSMIEFTYHSKYLLALIGSPDWTLQFWDWSKSKILAFLAIEVPIYSALCSSNDGSIISMNGTDFIRFYRIVDNDFLLLEQSKFQDEKIMSQCWLKESQDMLIAGSDTGSIYLFLRGNLLGLVESSPGFEHPIHSITAVSNGFYIGSSKGILLYYQYREEYNSKESEELLLARNIKFHTKVDCAQLDLCSSSGFIDHVFVNSINDVLFAMSSDGQLFGGSIEFPQNLSKKNVLKHVMSKFHQPVSIVSFDICMMKSLLVSCSQDRSFKLWNFQTHKIELEKHFIEEMTSVAIHPTGLHCIIGFTDKIRFYHILYHDLKLCLEMSLKNSKSIQFSKSGKYIAFIVNNIISVVDFITGDKLHDLRGHNSKVRSFQWLGDEINVGSHFLISTGQDGAVYLWDVVRGKRVNEYIHKGINFFSLSYCSGSNNEELSDNSSTNISSNASIYIVGSDKLLRQLSYPDLQLVKTVELNVVFSSIVASSKHNGVIVASNEFNSPTVLRSFLIPLTIATGEYEQHLCSSIQLSSMKLSNDESTLFVTDNMGCIYIYSLRNRNNLDIINRNAFDMHRDPLFNDILIMKTEYNEMITSLQELKNQYNESSARIDYRLKLLDKTASEEYQSLSKKYITLLSDIEKAKLLYVQQRETHLQDNDSKCTELEEEQFYSLQQIESRWQQEIMKTVSEFHELSKQRDEFVDTTKEKKQLQIRSHEQYIEELNSKFQSSLAEERSKRLVLQTTSDDLQKAAEEIQTQLEDDIDCEIESSKTSLSNQLELTRDEAIKWKGENAIIDKKILIFSREISELKDELKVLVDTEKSFHQDISLLENEIKVYKKDIKARDNTIIEREKKILDMKKKNQELEKFKYVLDYKINELKQNIEPREKEIAAMREKISSMDFELAKFHQVNEELDVQIGSIRENIDNVSKNIKVQRELSLIHEHSINHFLDDLKQATESIQQVTALKDSVVKLINRHGNPSLADNDIDNNSLEEEYHRHRTFLKNAIQHMKKESYTINSVNLIENNSMIKQNRLLLDEIYKVREENNAMRQQIYALASDIRRVTLESKKYQMLSENGEADNLSLNMTDTSNLENSLPVLDIIDRKSKKIQTMKLILSELNKKKASIVPDVSDVQVLDKIIEGEELTIPFLTSKVVSLSDPLDILQIQDAATNKELISSLVNEKKSTELPDISK